MDYWTVLGIILFVAVAFLAFKVAKKAMQAALFVLSLAFVISLVIAAVVVVDAIRFKDRFSSSDNLFLLKQDNDVMTGFQVGNGTNALTAGEAADYSSYLASGNKKEMLGDNYRVVLINIAVVDEIGSVTANNQSFPANVVRDIFASDDEASKQMFFALISEKVFASPTFFFEQYKKGNIEVYPETPMFRFIRLVPTSFVKSVGEKAFEKFKSVAVEGLG